MLTRQDKEQIVSGLREKIEKAQALFLTNLIGIESNKAVELRKKVRDAKGTIAVTRNTLFRLAAKGTYAEELLSDLKGTNAIAFAFDDAPSVAKVIFEAKSEDEVITINKGILDGKVLSEQEVVALAKLPSRDQMLATLLATFNAPVSAFVRVLDAIKNDKESNAA
jgi:large subunit ribosomal protein L10